MLAVTEESAGGEPEDGPLAGIPKNGGVERTGQGPRGEGGAGGREGQAFNGLAESAAVEGREEREGKGDDGECGGQSEGGGVAGERPEAAGERLPEIEKPVRREIEGPVEACADGVGGIGREEEEGEAGEQIEDLKE